MKKIKHLLFSALFILISSQSFATDLRLELSIKYLDSIISINEIKEIKSDPSTNYVVDLRHIWWQTNENRQVTFLPPISEQTKEYFNQQLRSLYREKGIAFYIVLSPVVITHVSEINFERIWGDGISFDSKYGSTDFFPSPTGDIICHPYVKPRENYSPNEDRILAISSRLGDLLWKTDSENPQYQVIENKIAKLDLALEQARLKDNDHIVSGTTPYNEYLAKRKVLFDESHDYFKEFVRQLAAKSKISDKAQKGVLLDVESLASFNITPNSVSTQNNDRTISVTTEKKIKHQFYLAVGKHVSAKSQNKHVPAFKAISENIAAWRTAQSNYNLSDNIDKYLTDVSLYLYEQNWKEPIHNDNSANIISVNHVDFSSPIASLINCLNRNSASGDNYDESSTNTVLQSINNNSTISLSPEQCSGVSIEVQDHAKLIECMDKEFFIKDLKYILNKGLGHRDDANTYDPLAELHQDAPSTRMKVIITSDDKLYQSKTANQLLEESNVSAEMHEIIIAIHYQSNSASVGRHQLNAQVTCRYNVNYDKILHDIADASHTGHAYYKVRETGDVQYIPEALGDHNPETYEFIGFYMVKDHNHYPYYTNVKGGYNYVRFVEWDAEFNDMMNNHMRKYGKTYAKVVVIAAGVLAGGATALCFAEGAITSSTIVSFIAETVTVEKMAVGGSASALFDYALQMGIHHFFGQSKGPFKPNYAHIATSFVEGAAVVKYKEAALVLSCGAGATREMFIGKETTVGKVTLACAQDVVYTMILKSMFDNGFYLQKLKEAINNEGATLYAGLKLMGFEGEKLKTAYNYICTKINLRGNLSNIRTYLKDEIDKANEDFYQHVRTSTYTNPLSDPKAVIKFTKLATLNIGYYTELTFEQLLVHLPEKVKSIVLKNRSAYKEKFDELAPTNNTEFRTLLGSRFDDFSDAVKHLTPTDLNQFKRAITNLGDDATHFIDDLIANKSKWADEGLTINILDINGWKRLNTLGRHQIKNDPLILRAFSTIDRNPNITSNQIDGIIDRLTRGGTRCKTCRNTGKKDLRYINEVLDDLDRFSTEFHNTRGFNEFIDEMIYSSKKATGGSWTLEALMNYRSKYFGRETIIGFEINHVPGREFAADVVTSSGNRRSFYEFKNWGSSQLGYSQSKFVEQLTGTLSVINDLNQVKYIFNPNRWTPNPSQIRTALLKDKHLIEELDAMLKVSLFKTRNTNEIIDILTDQEVFTSIFKTN